MTFNKTFNSWSQIDAMDNMLQSAKVRYNRQDFGGASNNFYNMSRAIKGNYNLKDVRPLKGTFEQAKEFYLEGKLLRSLSILKYIQTEVLYGRYVFD